MLSPSVLFSSLMLSDSDHQPRIIQELEQRPSRHRERLRQYLAYCPPSPRVGGAPPKVCLLPANDSRLNRCVIRAGADAMMHLLTETSLFMMLPNDCLCQLTGPPLVAQKAPQLPPPDFKFRDMPKAEKRKANVQAGEERPAKRQRTNAGTSAAPNVGAVSSVPAPPPADTKRLPTYVHYLA
jgi:hypothetical protein